MKNKFEKYKKIYKQFGFLFSIKYFYYKLTHKDDKYISLVYNYLLNYMSPLIKKYDERKEKTIEEIKEPIPVWVCWWQGYDNMPELCKMLYKRLNNMLPHNAKLTLITVDNYLQYASIPQNIVDKFNKGLISYTFYSDILRSYLIRDNGRIMD